MDDPGLFVRYEQRENSGKVIGERKYQPKAIKDVERKLATLGKKINQLHHHRQRAYNNSVRIKKNIHCHVNQIVKSFRDRERNLLSDVDESYIAQVSSIDDEIEKLLTTNVCCQTLYSGLYDFKENRNVLYEINDILSTVNIDEKPEYKKLELISNLEQAKFYANSYGNLDGPYVKKDLADATKEDSESSAISQEQSPDKDAPEQAYSVVNMKFLEKNHKRERTESQDSFELIELLDNIHCHDSKGSLDEKNKNVDLLNRSADDDSDNFVEDIPENFAGASKSPLRKDGLFCLEKRIMEMNKQLETIVSSTPKFNVPQGKIIKPVKQVQGSEGKKGSQSHVRYKTWLHKTPQKVNAMEIDNVQNYFGANTASPAEIIKKAFSPYLANENIESWLASKNTKS